MDTTSAGATPVDPGRYGGKPMLRLIECYVLRAIGELPAAQEAQLHAMLPNLNAAFGTDAGTWHEAVEQTMHFPPGLVERLRTVWSSNEAEDRARGTSLDPEDWTRAVVDEAGFTR